MSRIASLAALALVSIAGAAAMASPAAAKACVGSICAESRDDKRTVNVYLSFNGANWSHFQVRRNGVQYNVQPGQVFSFKYRKGYNQHYSVQVCNKGGFLQKTSCTGWVRFHHES